MTPAEKKKLQYQEAGIQSKRDKKGWLYCSAVLFVCLALASFPASAQDDLLSSLSLEQKVGQMFIVKLFGSQTTEAGRDFLRQWQPGGVVLIGENNGTPEAVTRLTNDYQATIIEAGGIPLLVAVDQEPGPISHLKEGFTQFPTPTLITATTDPQLAYQVGAATAEELLAVGVNMNLSPVADLETNRNNPIIKRRSFGSDPAMVSPIIGGYVEGVQAGGVLATAKHFPGHGDSSDDSHTGLPIIDLSQERLKTVELAPFRAAIEADVAVMMVAHIWYPALEPESNLPASLSPNIVTELLRGELGYDGLIMTDAMDMDAIDTVYSYPNAVIKAIQAGVDLVIAAHISEATQAQAIQAVVEAIRNGVISEARIDESVQRILNAKERFGLLDWQPLDPNTASERIDLNGHAALIQELFDAGTTVAHDSNDFIPISDNQRAAIVYPATRVQVANECGQYRPDIRWVGVSDTPSDEEIGWARDAAAGSDVIVVFTQNADENPQQAALVNALPPEKTAVVALWSPYDITRFPGIAAYMVTYSPARAAVPSACAILFGAIAANGRLAVSLTPA